MGGGMEEGPGRVLRPADPLGFRVERNGLGLAWAGLEKETVVVQLARSFFDGVHQGRGGAAATQVGSNPQSLDLTGQRGAITNWAQPDTARQVAIEARHEECAARGRQFVHRKVLGIVRSAVSPYELIDGGEVNTSGPTRLERLVADREV